MTTISLPYGQLEERLGIRQARQLRDTVSARPTRLQVTLWVGLLLLSALLFVRGYRSEQVGLYPDEAQYVVLAESLLHSSQYGLINFPGQPHLSTYPFGYPLLLAPFVLFLPDSLDGPKLLSLLMTLVNVSLLFWGWRWLTRHYSYWWALAVAALYALAPLTVNHSWMAMSEPTFTAFALMAMILTEQAVRAQHGRWWGVLMGVMLTFVLFTRSAGFVFMLSIVLYLLLVLRRSIVPQLSVALVSMVLFVALVVVGTAVDTRDLLPARYVNEAASAAASPPAHVTPSNAPVPLGNVIQSRLTFIVMQNLMVDLREAVIPVGGGLREQELLAQYGVTSLSLLIGTAVCVLLLIGFVHWFRRDGLSIFLLVVVPYWALLFVWVWKENRLLYPIEPQLFFSLLLGVQAIMLGAAGLMQRASLVTRVAKIALPAFVIAMIAVSAYKSATIDDTRLHVGDIEQRSLWLKANTSPSIVVMSEHPETDYLYADRKTVAYPELTDNYQERELLVYLRQQQVQYILVAPHKWWQDDYTPAYSTDTRQLLPLFDHLTAQNRLALVHHEDNTLIRVYQVLP